MRFVVNKTAHTQEGPFMESLPRQSNKARGFVRRRIRGASSQAERMRFLCLQALWRHRTPEEISGALGIGRATVYRVLKTATSQGIDALVDGRSRRGPIKVTAGYISMLIRLVERPPDFDTYHRSQWTAALPVRVLAEETGILLHVSWLWQLLCRSGYRWKRTRPWFDPGGVGAARQSDRLAFPASL